MCVRDADYGTDLSQAPSVLKPQERLRLYTDVITEVTHDFAHGFISVTLSRVTVSLRLIKKKKAKV